MTTIDSEDEIGKLLNSKSVPLDVKDGIIKEMYVGRMLDSHDAGITMPLAKELFATGQLDIIQDRIKRSGLLDSNPVSYAQWFVYGSRAHVKKGVDPILGKYNILAIPTSISSPFELEWVEGAFDEVAQDRRFAITALSAVHENDVATQKECIKVAINKEYDGILISMNFPTELRPLLEQFKELGKNRKVVGVPDSTLQFPEVDSVVGFDQRKPSQLQADYIKHRLFPVLDKRNWNHEIVYLGGVKDSDTQVKRENGFMTAMPKGWGVSIYYGDYEATGGYVLGKKIIPELKGIMKEGKLPLVIKADSDGMVQGFMKAKNEICPELLVFGLGIDIAYPTRKAIKTHQQVASTGVSGLKIGRRAAELMMHALQGIPIRSQVPMEPVVMDVNNLHRFDQLH